MEALPELSRLMVTFLQLAIGATVSRTVTVNWQEEELPEASDTVKVTA